VNFSEIWVITEDELLRCPKIRYLLSISGIFVFLCLLLIHYSTSILSLFPFGNDVNIPHYLISYLLVLFLAPFVVMVASYDFISNELETGSIRYVISKIDRTSFILGKFLALFIVFTFVVSVIAVMGSVYAYFSGNAPHIGETVLFWILSSLYLGCFVSIFLFISTLSENNKTSFLMSIVFIVILLFLFLQGYDNYLKYLTPYFYGIENIGILRGSLQDVEFIKLLQNIFIMLLYSILFISMSLSAIKRRDL